MFEKKSVPEDQLFKEVIDWYATHPWTGEKGWHRMTITAVDYQTLMFQVNTRVRDKWQLWMIGTEQVKPGKLMRHVAVLFLSRRGVMVADSQLAEAVPTTVAV